MKKLIIVSLLTVFSSAALADNVIITETKSWKSVPIVVDPATQAYTVESTAVPAEGDYYYTYSGYRCLKSKKDIPGMVTLRSKTPGGSEIYCYPE